MMTAASLTSTRKPSAATPREDERTHLAQPAMGKRKVAFVHTSPAAVGPLMQFYAESAPELESTNLLDDGLLRPLAAGDAATAEARPTDGIGVAAETCGHHRRLLNRLAAGDGGERRARHVAGGRARGCAEEFR